MDFISIFFIAVGLSFDTFAVSVSSGLIKKEISFFNAMKISFSLAFFQSVMPVIGWLAGYQVKDYIEAYDHWLAFTLLSILGIKMIYESIKSGKNKKNFDPLDFWILIGMSVATSIDALIVGVSFAFINVSIFFSAVIIGIVTFFVAMLGILFGKKAVSGLGNKMEIIGGIILIGIGIKILIQHLSTN